MQEMMNLSNRRRMQWILIVSFLIFLLLTVRIGFLQFVQGSELQAMAYNQQTLNRKISPKRGTIYDATGTNILAVSSTVETVTVNPVNIKEEEKEKVARALSDIFSLDYEMVYKKVTKKSSIETIVKKVEKEQTDILRKWMDENKIESGINIDEDTKRYYPYNSLASQVIGFCGSDNQGLGGIEAKYDTVLQGSYGKIQKVTDAKGGDILDETEQYIPAKDGKNLILSIDLTIQSIVEKYLKNACIDNECTDGGNVIVMNPKTGDIYAMAGYPDYNLNDPYIPIEEEKKALWNSLSSSDKNKEMQAMWRNKAIADTYEPGSTFKLITSSAALEEKITVPDKEGEFNCGGGIEIAGVRIKCWRYYRPHGAQSLRQALMNSCNPVFIALGQKIGVEKYYNYLERFGFLEKTGIDLPGEAKGIFLAEKKVGPVELATISFGQRFEVTPLQMVTAVASIANGGEHVRPRIVKEIVDSETGDRQEVPIQKGDRVISKETADNVLSMMESVVAEGTGKNAQVKGYRVGGKTGTSEDGVNTGKYVTSFIGVAPISDPQVVVLVTLYNPTGEGGHQGGGVAAPVGGQILSEILPYLTLQQDNKQEEEKQEVIIPEFRGLTLEEAEKIGKEKGLSLTIQKEEKQEINKKEAIIKEQVPKPGIAIKSGGNVYVEI